MYDLVVIGGGPAGYTGAIRASKLGMKTALIEEREKGGTCLNRGCIPTKVLLHSGEMLESIATMSEFGVMASLQGFDQKQVYQRKDNIVTTLSSGIQSLLKANGVDLYDCHGQIKDNHTVLAGENQLQTKFILIATGSKPAGFDPKRPLVGIENTLNSDDVLSAPIEDDNITIIGGGVIAVEFSAYFSSIGKNVTMIVSSDRIIRMMSKDLSLQLSSVLKKKGVKIITNAKVLSLAKESVEIETLSGVQTIEGRVITAAGRVSNFDGLALENIGLGGRYITVDDNMFTGVDGVYAAGDVTGRTQLAHYAAASAITAVESMLGMPHSMNLDVCPSCIYTSPEIATVGDVTIEEGDKVGKFMMGGNGKTMIEGEKRGYIKIVSTSDDIVKGAELFSLRATDMIGELALIVAKKMTAEEAAAVIHAHPTIMEGVAEALEDISSLATHIAPKRK
jgi:dihydrolipoamide dehydrogenase